MICPCGDRLASSPPIIPHPHEEECRVKVQLKLHFGTITEHRKYCETAPSQLYARWVGEIAGKMGRLDG